MKRVYIAFIILIATTINARSDTINNDIAIKKVDNFTIDQRHIEHKNVQKKINNSKKIFIDHPSIGITKQSVTQIGSENNVGNLTGQENH